MKFIIQVIAFAIACGWIQTAFAQTPTKSPTVIPLNSFIKFYDATAGAAWNRCELKRATPCSCSTTFGVTITCSGTIIKKVELQDNNLVAVEFPTTYIKNLINSGMTSIDLTGNPNLAPGLSCVNLPECKLQGVTCTFDIPVCDAGSIPPTTASVGTSAPTSKSTTKQPTNKGTAAPTVASLNSWTKLYDATAGTAWARCEIKRSTPCSCSTTFGVAVTCTGTVIKTIALRNNNLVGATFPTMFVANLIRAGATSVDLRENPNLAPGLSCVNIPECLLQGITCMFDAPVCTSSGGTSSPVNGGGPTVQPTQPTTQRPSSFPTTLVPGSTESPTIPSEYEGNATTPSPFMEYEVVRSTAPSASQVGNTITPSLSPTALTPTTATPSLSPNTPSAPPTAPPTASPVRTAAGASLGMSYTSMCVTMITFVIILFGQA